MKLGVYVQTWHVGGVASFCERLAVGFKRLGHEPCLLLSTPCGKRDAAGKAAYEKIVRGQAFPVDCLHLNAWHPRERAWRAAEHMAALNLDSLFLSSHGPLAECLPWLASKTVLIGIAHTDDEDTYAEFQATGAACQAYSAVSVPIFQRLRELAGESSRTELKQIPYGVPIANAEAACPTGVARVLVVSRLNQYQKRVLDLPVIWKLFRELGGKASLTICGSGEEESRLRQEFEKQSRDRAVTVRGAVPLEQMPQIYAEHDILLSVSGYEGLPIAVLEATTHGLYPILSEIRSGHREIIETVGQGKLCAVGNVKAFASALLEATQQISSRRSLRGEIRKNAQARYSLERMVGDYENLAKKIGEERKAANSTDGKAMLQRPTVDPVRRWIRKWQYSRHYDTR